MVRSTAAEDEPVVRKVQIAGGSTFTVSLPKDWAEAQGLEPGSKLWLYALEDRVVVAPRTESPADSTCEIQADGLDRGALARRVRAAYTAGSDRIVVTAPDGLSTEQRRAATDALGELVGVEVDHGEGSAVAARSMLDASAVSLEQTLRQLRRLTMSMYREAVDAVCEDDPDLAVAVERRTEDVDRLVALVARQFRAALVDVGEVERLETGRATAFRHHRTAACLGDVARDAAAIAAVAGEQASPPPEAVAECLRACGGCVREVLGAALGDTPAAIEEGRQELTGAVDRLDDVLATTDDPDRHRYGRLRERFQVTNEATEAIATAGCRAELTDDGRN